MLKINFHKIFPTPKSNLLTKLLLKLVKTPSTPKMLSNLGPLVSLLSQQTLNRHLHSTHAPVLVLQLTLKPSPSSLLVINLLLLPVVPLSVLHTLLLFQTLTVLVKPSFLVPFTGSLNNPHKHFSPYFNYTLINN